MVGSPPLIEIREWGQPAAVAPPQDDDQAAKLPDRNTRDQIDDRDPP
jgi:hypothetical protein